MALHYGIDYITLTDNDLNILHRMTKCLLEHPERQRWARNCNKVQGSRSSVIGELSGLVRQNLFSLLCWIRYSKLFYARNSKTIANIFGITWILKALYSPSSSALTSLIQISKEMNNVGLETRAHLYLYQCKGGSKQTKIRGGI